MSFHMQHNMTDISFSGMIWLYQKNSDPVQSRPVRFHPRQPLLRYLIFPHKFPDRNYQKDTIFLPSIFLFFGVHGAGHNKVVFSISGNTS